MSDSSDPLHEPSTPPSQELAATDSTEDGAPPPDTYNPADYRWVPVRRRPRTDGWTEEKQRRFIETLADTGLVGAAAKAVGMTRETAYRLRRPTTHPPCRPPRSPHCRGRFSYTPRHALNASLLFDSKEQGS